MSENTSKEVFDITNPENLPWSKDKLLQTNGDDEFLLEKIHKWKSLAYHFDGREERVSPYLTDSINKKFVQGKTLKEWLYTLYTPLEATILAYTFTAWEWIDPLIGSQMGVEDKRDSKISLAIAMVEIKATMPEGIEGTFTDISEPDLRLFSKDVSMLDIINIMDREVAAYLYK